MDFLTLKTAIGARPTNSLTDLVLCVELVLFFTVWCRGWPSAVKNKKVDFFVVYAFNLLGAAAWCLLGAYLHLWEPLPAEPNRQWRAFLLLGALTPTLFPIVVARAFALGQAHVKKQYFGATIAALIYMFVVFSGIDLSGGLQVAPIYITPWHVIDGRSYGGQKYGISFDLVSSFPCWRGDSNFVLSIVFVASNMLDVVLLVSVVWADHGAYAKEIICLAKRLTVSVGLMVLNCLLLPHLIVVFNVSMATALDVFHIMQGLIMGAVFMDLQTMLRHKNKKMD